MNPHILNETGFDLRTDVFYKRLRARFLGTGIKEQRGIGVVEILVAVAVIGVSLVSLMGLADFALKINAGLKKDLAAANLASEAIEAGRAIKDEGWNILASYSSAVPYHPFRSGDKWILAVGAETLGDFSRQIILEDVYRDASDNITASGGALDPNTRKISVTVAWTERGSARQVSLTSYFTDWQP